MRPWNALRLALRSVRRRGVLRSVARIPSYLSRQKTFREFDRARGIDTEGVRVVSADEVVGGNASHSSTHLPTTPEYFEAAMAAMPVAPEEFVFIDIGSGLGRAVCLASEYPFRRIIGVEFSRELHRQAQRNVASYRSASQRCRDIELVCADATEYPLPAEDTVLYFYQPFDEAMFATMLAHIDRSLVSYPRRLVVLYMTPRHRHVFDGSPTFTLAAAKESSDRDLYGAWRIYVNTR